MRIAACFLQTDPRLNQEEAWPLRMFPASTGHYFRECGCLVTSLYNLLVLYGLNRFSSPKELHDAFCEASLYYDTANLELGRLHEVIPLSCIGRIDYSALALQEHIVLPGEMFLLRVKGVYGSHHFVLPYPTASEGIKVFDPLEGTRELSSYDDIQQLIFFRQETATARQ